MSAKHPARNVRQAIGAASVAAFVGAAIGIATNANNATQPANAATTPNTAPASSQFGQGDGGWNATVPNDNGFQSGGGASFGGGGGGQSHTRSGGS
ncbi:MAG TPA: hypothetical protein VGI86_06440 [Acidimicrobiia bacterium]